LILYQIVKNEIYHLIDLITLDMSVKVIRKLE